MNPFHNSHIIQSTREKCNRKFICKATFYLALHIKKTHFWKCKKKNNNNFLYIAQSYFQLNWNKFPFIHQKKEAFHFILNIVYIWKMKLGNCFWYYCNLHTLLQTSWCTNFDAYVSKFFVYNKFYWIEFLWAFYWRIKVMASLLLLN